MQPLEENIPLPRPFPTILAAFSDLFVFQKTRSWQQLSRPSQAMLVLTFCQALALFIIDTFMIVEDEERCADPPCKTETNLFYSVSLYIIAISLPYFAFSAIFGVNQYEHIAFLFNNIMIFVYAIIQISDNSGAIFWALLVLSMIFTTLSVFLSLYIIKEIGLEVFKIAITTKMDRNVLHLLQAYQMIIKFDLLMTLILIIMSGIFFLNFRDYQIYLTIFAGISSIIWAALGWIGIREVENFWTFIYYFLAIFQPVYTVYKMIQFWHDEEFPYSLFASAGCTGIVLRIAVTVSHTIVRKAYLLKYEEEARALTRQQSKMGLEVERIAPGSHMNTQLKREEI
eukprot:TRINITY_DN6194_c0_g1_i1.p1 TRINITY_DN6194_c0_g1~~TRINITY_DN6194_c0_g1_i1.p1  ORF type:complete len:341 (-),score=65.26 TRINITY_DN6194_c0_g1_i1:522-1544(-)